MMVTPGRELRAAVPGGIIAGWQAGTGPAVLILHGGPGLSDYTVPLAAEFEDAFGVIGYQQRGLAPSVTSGPFDIDRHVADAVAVLDAAGAGRAYVVGHSWGGHLAMHLAVRHPDRMLGLVLADPLGAVPLDPGPARHRQLPRAPARGDDPAARPEAGCTPSTGSSMIRSMTCEATRLPRGDPY